MFNSGSEIASRHHVVHKRLAVEKDTRIQFKIEFTLKGTSVDLWGLGKHPMTLKYDNYW